MDDIALPESPRKKPKLDKSSDMQLDAVPIPAKPLQPHITADMNRSEQQRQKETEVGILNFVDANSSGFGGVLKQRFGTTQP